jgi:hypothetical protein
MTDCSRTPRSVRTSTASQTPLGCDAHRGGNCQSRNTRCIFGLIAHLLRRVYQRRGGLSSMILKTTLRARIARATECTAVFFYRGFSYGRTLIHSTLLQAYSKRVGLRIVPVNAAFVVDHSVKQSNHVRDRFTRRALRPLTR